MSRHAELVKDVFALFGAAYCDSESLYRELCLDYALAPLTSSSLTQPRLEERLAHAYRLTFGQLVGQMREHLPDDLFRDLETAVDQRNSLAHRFWFERAHLMHSTEGLERLREELATLREHFSDLDERLTEHFTSKRGELGVTEGAVEQALAQVLAGEPMPPMHLQRFPAKQERLVRAWDVPTSSGLALVLETADGCLWQLCDVGLGWTHFGDVGSDWTVNERLQRYLPAVVNPRPKAEGAWNYEFSLAEHMVLWVKPGRAAKAFKWGLRKATKRPA